MLGGLQKRGKGGKSVNSPDLGSKKTSPDILKSHVNTKTNSD